jgi:hypothetical protein
MNTNLLKEAIAEADAIKKMAIENAKSSLNEAFDSKIKSMMAARLEEEADDLDLEEEYEEGYDDQDEAKHKEPDADNKGGKSDNDEDNMEEEYGEDADADEAFSLDAILAELEAGDVADDAAELAADDEVMEEEAEEDEAEEEMPKKKKEEEPAEEEEEDMDEEIDIAALLAEMEDGEEDEMKKEEKDPEKEDEDDMKSLEEEMMSLLEKMKEKKKAKLDKEEKMKEKPESEELQEIKRQAAELTQKVNETNLINAKLLYLNKILRKYNLSEQQKIKVIGAFDKAQTVNESKIVHESLDQAFSVKNDNIKSGLKESIGFASSAAGTSTKRVINEGVVGDVDKQVSRWQKLAGIIK